MSLLKRFLHEDEAATAVEYAVMLALIIITCLVAIGSFGTNLNSMFGDIHTNMELYD